MAPVVIETDFIAEEDKKEPEEVSSQEKLNINTATKEELMSVDGIGETIAARILKKRDELGNFKIIEQMIEVDGIGQKTFEKIKKYLTVE